MPIKRLKTYLIGGKGFIGYPLARSLSGTNRDVIIVGRSEPTDALPDNISYISGDYGMEEICELIISDANEIIDLAYATNPKSSYSNPLTDLMGNVSPAVQLMIRAGKSAILRKFVFLSSGGTVYGETQITPIKEICHNNPISPYGITKLAIEKYAYFFYKTAGLPISIVRPSNVYGPGQKTGTGQGFISHAIDAVLNNREIVIFGYPGTVRDYLFITDAVEGIKAVLEFGAHGEIYNLGTGVGLTNEDVLSILKSIITPYGYGIRVGKEPARIFDVKSNVLNSSKLSKISGWRSKVKLREGIEKMWEYSLSAQMEKV